MESLVFEDKEKELDVKQLMFYLIENIKIVIIVGLLCGIIVGAYGYIKTCQLDSEEAVNASIQDIIQKNRAKWNGLDLSVTADAFADPLPGTYMANVKLLVDFDYSSIEGNTNLDFSAMNGKLQGDAVAIAGSNESKQSLIDKLNLRSYEDMNNLSLEDLRYMISIGFLGANVMQIQVADTNPDRAISIADSLAGSFVDGASQTEMIDSVTLLEGPYINYSSTYNHLSVKDYVKSTIKYSMFGVILGLFISCGLCVLIYLCNETVRSGNDLEYIGLEEFARIPLKGEKKGVEYRRAVYDISLLGKRNVCIISVDDYTSLDELKEKMSDERIKNDSSVKFYENLIDNPEIIFEAKKSDVTLLFSTYGKTLAKNLECSKRELDRAGVEIAGVILAGAKH